MLQKENTKHKKIKYKLLMILLPAVIAQILILVFVSGAISRRSMKKMATNALNSSITNQADNIEAWLEENIQNFSTVKQIIEKTQPSDKELQEIRHHTGDGAGADKAQRKNEQRGIRGRFSCPTNRMGQQNRL